ncbi:MAG: ATP-dependent DNA helicase RecG [Treponema sp.]|jgi:ATP-dependent DNA helicase RecG|nr:ATP-dependent DNA helicase RecG [Treponema sp.]
MFLRELSDEIGMLCSPKSKTAERLLKLGIKGARSLLTHYPRDYEDWGKKVPLKDYNRAKVCSVVKVLAHQWFGAGYMKTLKVIVEDDTERASLNCFNRPFLGKELPVGAMVKISGRFYYKYGEIQSSAFEIGGGEGILPVYPLTEGVTQKAVRNLTQKAVDRYASSLENELPGDIIKREGLIPKAEAIKAIHYPASMKEKDSACKTLVYEELFYLEIMIAKRAIARRSSQINTNIIDSHAGPCPVSALQKRLVERLPFKLTPGQLKAAGEISRDMESPSPMARLLQGDVGSGKTLVAFFACLGAVEKENSGGKGQAVIMAPTELLARQHAENAAKILEPLGLRIAFLTGNVKAKGRAHLLKALASGDVDIVCGTHALFSRDVVYKNLRLVVIDEQHRFGVTQRQAIMVKGPEGGPAPSLLMMSATPIPRTLALTVFGDLDVSVISDMPPGREPVETHLAKESNAEKVYNFVRKELAAGRQAYFVYPLIEASEERDLKDAQSMFRHLAETVFPEFKAALIHSRLPEETKRGVMDAFRTGDIKILVATSVVEVGVDVPSATCIVIEHAERFGLSALHQLRGRVGRGGGKSYCFLIYSDQKVPEKFFGLNPEDLSEEDRSKEGRRLMVMLENTDGFVIAEKDLEFRGPGQITGFAQSGYFTLGLADLVRDAKALERARADAFAMLENDPCLQKDEYRCVAEVLKRAPPFSDVVL